MDVVPHIGIDCGSRQLRAVLRGAGEESVYSTRSLLVRDVVSGDVIAIGDAAVDHVLQPGEERIQPVKRGSVIDYEGAISLFTTAISSVLSWWHIFQPRVVVSESLSLSRAVSQATAEAVQSAGAGTVYMTSVPELAALGVGIEPYNSSGNLVLDIGHETTEAAVVSRGSAVAANYADVGGVDLISALQHDLTSRYEIGVDTQTAEAVLHAAGSALHRDNASTHEFYANTKSGEGTRSISVSSNEVAAAIHEPLAEITAVAADLIKKAPTALLSDIAENGLIITGGVAHLPHIDTYLSRELSISVRVAERPEAAVIRGCEKALSFVSVYERFVPQTEV